MHFFASLFHLGRVLFNGPTRKPPNIQYHLPPDHYDPIWGSPGLVHAPRVTSGKLNIPYQNTYVNTGNFSVPWRDSIINNPLFWDKYYVRKTRAWGQNYDPIQQLTADSFPLSQRSRKFQDIGVGKALHTDRAHSPFFNTPYQVPNNSKRY
jgi:hypothetical protein